MFGGRFVKSLLDDGHPVVGLEVSDRSKKLRSSEWGTCRHYLLDC